MRKRLILMVYSCPVFQPKRKRLQQESGNEAEKDVSGHLSKENVVCRERKTAYFMRSAPWLRVISSAMWIQQKLDQ